jgi:hypothetical protein
MKLKLFLAVVGLIVFLAACSQPAGNNTTRGQTLDKALAELMPELEDFKIVKVDDGKLIEELKAHAERASRDPLYISLPIMTAKGEIISDFEFTVYPNNLRPEGGIEVIAFDPENERGKVMEFLSGPSLTFSGFPDVEEEEFLKILEQAKGTEYNEALYQPGQTHQMAFRTLRA